MESRLRCSAVCCLAAARWRGSARLGGRAGKGLPAKPGPRQMSAPHSKQDIPSPSPTPALLPAYTRIPTARLAKLNSLFYELVVRELRGARRRFKHRPLAGRTNRICCTGVGGRARQAEAGQAADCRHTMQVQCGLRTPCGLRAAGTAGCAGCCLPPGGRLLTSQ